MEIFIKIKDKETGEISERVNIKDIIFNSDEVEYIFKDGSTLPHYDFLMFKSGYEIIYIVERK